MQSVISRRPNLTSQQQAASAGGSEKLVEASILEFHSRRRQLAECLRFIVEAAVVGQLDVDGTTLSSTSAAGQVPDVCQQLELFVRQELLASARSTTIRSSATSEVGSGYGGGLTTRAVQPSGHGGFPLKLLREIEKIGDIVETVRSARQNARTETVGPSQGQGSSIPHLQ